MFDMEKISAKAVEPSENKIFEYADAKDNVENVSSMHDGNNGEIKESLIN